MRKLDTGEKAQILGKMRKGNGMWKEPCEFSQRQTNQRCVKSKNSLATRNDRPAIYYEANSGKRGASMTRGKHKLVATMYAAGSRKDMLSPVSPFNVGSGTVHLGHSPLSYSTLRNGLKFINLASPLF